MNENAEKNGILSPRKKIIYSILMAVLSVMCTLLIAEVGIRLFFPQQEAMQWFVSNDRYGFVMKRNFYQKYHYSGSNFSMNVRTNSLGLRDKEYDFTRIDQRRVLLLGDSFTFGYGVDAEDNFDNKLEKLLNEHGDKWIVINAGHGGWGTLQEKLYAEDHFDLFRPDIIVLTFCENDPSDDLHFTEKKHDSEKGVIPFPGKILIRNHSHLYRLLFITYKIWLNKWRLHEQLNNINNKDIYVDKRSATVFTEERWNTTLGYIKDLHNDFLRFNPNGILLVQTSSPLNENIRKHLGSLSNEESLFYVDLYDNVSRLKPEETRLPYDGHWSSLMHSISALNLYDTIIKIAKGRSFEISLTINGNK